MPRARRFQLWSLAAAAFWAGATAAAGAGSENFNNFPVTGSTYTNGTFLGQDGSTWTYAWCRGDKTIAPAPLRTPGIDKGRTPAAGLASGTIAGGCGTISFDWMKMFTGTVSVDVVINDTVRHTVSGGVQNVTNHAGPLAINVGVDPALFAPMEKFAK